MNKNDIIKILDANRGKIFSVKFRKKNGEIREMVARQAVREGSTPLRGGAWARGAADPKDYGLILCSDMAKEKAGEYSRRSFSVDSVLEIKIAGEIYKFD